MANLWKPARIALALAAAALLTVPFARADVVTDWNERAVAAGYTGRLSPDMHSRNMAIVHIAIFEALNSIEPRYTPYRARLQAEPGSSREAAAAAAAHHVLVRLFPEQARELDVALQQSLASVPEGAA